MLAPYKVSERNTVYYTNLTAENFSFNHSHNPFIQYNRDKQFRLMINYLKPSPDDRILCVGVGSGRELEILSNYVEKLYGVDISEKLLLHCSDKFKDRFDGCLCNLEKDKTIYDVDYFDKVVCLNVLPYFSKSGMHNFFREMSRIVQDNGELFMFILNAHFPVSEALQKQSQKNRQKCSKPIYYYRPISDYVNVFSRYGFVVRNAEGGDFYCDINSWFFKYLFNFRWSKLLLRLMDFGGRTTLKRYYRSLYLTLTNQSYSQY